MCQGLCVIVNESNKYARSLQNLKIPTKKFDLDAMLGLSTNRTSFQTHSGTFRLSKFSPAALKICIFLKSLVFSLKSLVLLTHHPTTPS